MKQYCVVKKERYWIEANSEDDAISAIKKLDYCDDIEYDIYCEVE